MTANDTQRPLHIAFLNPQGNFDPADSYWTAHPDFGGQLVYVKEVALGLGRQGHRVDIVTRHIVDPDWLPFAATEDHYPDAPNVRILRVPCGPQGFVAKEALWPHLREWVANIAALYEREGAWPDVCTGHYADGGVAAAALQVSQAIPFTFTGHSLGAQKRDRLLETKPEGAAELEARYHFAERLEAERVAMHRAGAVITNSGQEQREQYAHPVYVGAVDPEDQAHFAVIPPGANLTIFDKGSRSPREDEIRAVVAARWERDIAPERQHLPAIIASMRLDPKKNHIGLVKAFLGSPELREQANLLLIIRGSDHPLRDWAGASADEQALLKAMNEAITAGDGWGSVTSFALAGQDAIAATFRWASASKGVFCLPALYEPFGLGVIEAMVAGLPVVATSFGGPQEISDGGRAVLLADPTNEPELAAQLLRLIGDAALWQEYADAGYQRVLDRYTWERTAASYASVAYALLRGERRGGDALPLPAWIA